MKTKTELVIISAIIIALVVFFYCLSEAGIEGTGHDFTDETWNPSGEMCNVCHTPHGGNKDTSVLWAHGVTTATYTLYGSETLDATIEEQGTGSSKLCLSCHDGTVAVDNYRGNPNPPGYFKTLRLDRRGSHPISFVFDGALANKDEQLNDPNSVGVEKLLYNGKVECSSCHDVHNYNNLEHILIMSNERSALCLICHNKR